MTYLDDWWLHSVQSSGLQGAITGGPHDPPLRDAHGELHASDLPCVALLASTLFGLAACVNTPGSDTANAAPNKASTAADGCAAKLSPEASLVYRVAALDMRPNTDLAVLLRERVMMLVFTDQLDRGAARPAAEQAAECLEQLRH